jgi:hypothetical protein
MPGAYAPVDEVVVDARTDARDDVVSLCGVRVEVVVRLRIAGHLLKRLRVGRRPERHRRHANSVRLGLVGLFDWIRGHLGVLLAVAQHEDDLGRVASSVVGQLVLVGSVDRLGEVLPVVVVL